MKPRFFLSFFALLATLAACSTISDRQTYSYPLPPASTADIWGRDPLQIDQQLELKHLKDARNQPLTLLVRYQQAKLWMTKEPLKSCALWNEVLSEPRFPLFRIARLYAMEVCPPLPARFPSIDDVMISTPEPWLENHLSKASLTRAQITQDKAWEMRLSFKVAENQKLQSEKIKYLQRAGELAQELNDATNMAAAKNKLEALAPRFIIQPAPELWLKVAADFKQARDFERARKTYQSVVDSNDFNSLDKLKALDGIRMSYKLEKKTEAFIESSRAFTDFAHLQFLKRGLKLAKSGQSEGHALLNKYFDTRLTLARAVWTEGQPADAWTILLKTENELRGTVPIYDAIFTRARIEEEAGHFTQAVSLLDTIDIKHVTAHDMRMKILWYRAWNLRKAGRLSESAEALLDLIPQEESSTQAARDRFWYARALKETGELQKAAAEFQSLIDADAASESHGWYALLAFRETNQSIPALPETDRSLANSTLEVPTQESALKSEDRLVFEWLLAAGENELARRFLDHLNEGRKTSPTQLLDMLQSYARTGDFQIVFARLSELSSELRRSLVGRHPELLFPQPWPQLVKAASAKFDVQTELIYSIMRQESSFNPLARSPADAFGLMQLIPEMAKKAESTAGIQIQSHEDLYTPETNIPLGTAFVHDLLIKWQGGFIPTVASYNASEKAVTGWVKSRYRGDPLVFIEDVPYEETRNYIKLAMRNFITYQRLNSGGAPTPFPEWCLANLQDIKL